MKKSVKEMFNSIKEIQTDDGESVYEIKDFVPTFCKKVDEELDYAEKCHSLEEQLGCPLEVVFKALEISVIYYQNNNGYTYEMRGIGLKYLNEWCLTDGNHYPDVKDYKKTWWLKEDKSE